MDHADFRVRGKIFATLSPNLDWGMVKIPPALQEKLVKRDPQAFETFNGAWGRQGCTKVWLKVAVKTEVRDALLAAWRKNAPQKLVKEYESEDT